MQASRKTIQTKALREYYAEVRSYTEKLCEPLEIEDYIPQPVVDVSPPKWNIAHTTWFFEEMILKKYLPGYKVFDEHFGFLFNSYYNSIGDRTARDHRGALSRPTVKQVFAYRKYVDEHMERLLSEPPAVAGGITQPSINAREAATTPPHPDLTAPNLQPPATAGGSDLVDLVILGLNHEQQHQELFLTDLKYTFSTNPLFPVYRDSYAPEESEPPAVAGGLTQSSNNPREATTTPHHPDLTVARLQPPATAGGSDLVDLVILGLNHEQQHQELFLTDLKYTFSTNPLFPVYRDSYAPEESEPPAVAGGLTQSSNNPREATTTPHHPDLTVARLQPPANAGGSDIAAGVYEIGFVGDGFCFDNELARHKVYLDDFTISNRLVTNAEFIEFIDAGGYTDHRLWHSEGWDWVNQNGIESPLYWQIGNAECGVRSAESTDVNASEWYHYTLGGLRKLRMDAPVCHVSYYEAAAFAEWKGMRLPTEAEWETANEKFNWGQRWEWTNSAYLPYPGFARAAGAVGEYNGKFMINQMILRGASVITPPGHSRPTYRNFFHPHLRWQFTGIRLVK